MLLFSIGYGAVSMGTVLMLPFCFPKIDRLPSAKGALNEIDTKTLVTPREEGEL